MKQCDRKRILMFVIFQVREIQDRNKPHCFELYACGGADIIKACKTDSEGKVSLNNYIYT